MDDLTRHADRLPDCDCHECAIYERNRLRAELAACREDAEKWRAYEARKRAVIDAGMGKIILRDAARKGEGAE